MIERKVGGPRISIAVALSGCAAIISLSVLAGWANNRLQLTSLVPGAVAMQPITAIGFIILCGGIAALSLSAPVASLVAAACILGVCSLTALEYLGVHVRLDDLFFSGQVKGQSGGYEYPGRMAPATTAIFAALAISVLSHASKRTVRYSAPLATLTLVIALTTALGYIFDVREFEAIGSRVHVAFPTAISFLILSIGLLTIPPLSSPVRLLLDRTIGGEIARRIVPIVVLVPIIFCYVAVEGSKYGFYPVSFRPVIISLGSATVMGGLTLWASAQLDRMSLRHRGEQDQLIAKLMKADAAAQAATQAKTLFLASMSHEIRTPLNGIIGMAHAISAGPLSQEQRDRLAILQDSGRSLLAILNDILDLTKVEAGKVELERVEFGMSDLLQSTYRTFEAIASEKGLKFTLSVEDVQGIYIGDPTRIRQVVSNLVSNALKFTMAGGVTIAARRSPTGIEIIVNDTGPGISPQYLPTLFTRFSQADLSTTRKFGGTGLGLAICRELIALMEGEITVSSVEGAGTSFTLALPLFRVKEEETDADAKLSPDSGADFTENEIRVLAADDNATNRAVIEILLSQIGLSVTLVENGAQAVEAWASMPWDLILMDIQMPVMDGLSATRSIREKERNLGMRRTPILAITANVMPEQREIYMAAGMDGVVCKPIEPSVLLSEISAAIGIGVEEEPLRESPASGFQNASI